MDSHVVRDDERQVRLNILCKGNWGGCCVDTAHVIAAKLAFGGIALRAIRVGLAVLVIAIHALLAHLANTNIYLKH